MYYAPCTHWNLYYYYYYDLLTAFGLLPGGSVTKIGHTYKEMDIHSKETKHRSHEKRAFTLLYRLKSVINLCVE
jgi:hypothetical protein